METDLTRLAETLHPLERKVLPHVAKQGHVEGLVATSGLSETEVIRALQWLSNKGVILLATAETEIAGLGKNGEAYAKDGLPERRFLKAVAMATLTLDEIGRRARLEQQEVSVCIGLLKRYGAIDLRDGTTISITEAGKALLQEELPEERLLRSLAKAPRELPALSPEEKAAFDGLRRRKEIVKVTPHKARTATLTPLGQKLAKMRLADESHDRLTPQMLKDGSWKGKTFRRYDVTTNVPRITGGRRHFDNQALEYIKRIWLDLGFTEMTGSCVHTAFWDLDALFVPQDHPARQMQDTFYIGKGSVEKGTLPKLWQSVKETHESGGRTGSTGWQAPWSEEEAKKLLLRTHTTVLSAQTLSRLKEKDIPAKFFSVGKVFRNEALDWKHLFEFYQVEGIVVDPDATLKHLKGYLRAFFGKMGYPDVRMRPAHFPYTEPSVEVDVLHPIKREWVELGGAGIFRPEVVVPLLGKDVPVLAWGLGMARIVPGYFGITDIRELYRNDLKQLREIKAWMRS